MSVPIDLAALYEALRAARAAAEAEAEESARTPGAAAYWHGQADGLSRAIDILTGQRLANIKK